MESVLPLFLTFISGLFIVLGSLIVFVTKNNDKFVQFAIGMALGVMASLICFELLPEASEVLYDYFGNLKGYFVLGICIFAGVIVLKLLDLFIPDHEHHNHSKQEQLDNLYHIGVVSSIALVLHNLIEGMAIYGTASTSLEMGCLVTLGVGFHNIPMGIVITSTFNRSTSRKKGKFILALLCISLSTLLGGCMMMFLSSFINSLFLGILLGLTLGMLLYIVLFELLEEVIAIDNRRLSCVGIFFGICIFALSLFFE